MSFKIIKKKSNLVEIVRQIKEQIKKGILKPGEKLPSNPIMNGLMKIIGEMLF